ncbi:NAD(P)/FAD-dependent oxidoreductase [Kribbella sp. NPDC051587]|uniref:NAD(P)/FAD-dependent oxidoreductase n=1 Tax=Kribbella sp. NPDC051587 TaxID=3364119 RepID=UPI003799D593
MGGSVAGLLAARVLADYAEEVVVIERDEAGQHAGPRSGVPQNRHGHVLLQGGQKQIERWFPGFARDTVARGGHLARPDQQVVYYDGRSQVPSSDASMLVGSRPLLEAGIRDRVLALPNVRMQVGQARGLSYDERRVSGVVVDDGLVSADFVVDATGRSSKLSSWLDSDGFQRPPMRRVKTGIHYATMQVKRSGGADEQELAFVLEHFRPNSMPFDLTAAYLSVIERDQWLMMLMTYNDHPAARSVEAFRATCAELSPTFGEVAGNTITRGIETFYQADSRRRDFSETPGFPAGLVAVGDAVASFNPIYGQGIASAALHASCLAEYLAGGPDVRQVAGDFFALQRIVVDAAWAISAGGDAARQDRIHGVDAPADVARQRWALEQVIQATLVDEQISEIWGAVTRMETHPIRLSDPKLIERAVGVNHPAGPGWVAGA